MILTKPFPDRWEIRRIDSLGEVITGTTPSTTHPEFYDGAIPFASPADLGNKRYILRTEKTLTSAGSQQARLLSPGSILVTCIGILGKVGQAQTTLATNQQINAFVPSSEIDISFAYWVMHLLQPQLEVEAGLQVVPIVNKSTFSALRIPLPPLPEQRRIAEILDAADDAIRQTERVIAKLCQVKAGLFHDLLTRGLDAQGRLRDPVAHPEQFKDSPLGRIPREWEVREIKQLATNKGDYGSGAAALQYNADFPRYVRITDITDDGILDPDSKASISPSNAEGYYLKSGDLLFARSGATVGKTYLYAEKDGQCAHAGYVIKFSLDSIVCNPRFVFHWTQSDFYWSWVKGTLRQGAQPNINAQEYSHHLLVYPSLEEQDRITAILDAVDTRIRAEEATLAKLRQVKRGLMDDLLTGRVRVV